MGGKRNSAPLTLTSDTKSDIRLHILASALTPVRPDLDVKPHEFLLYQDNPYLSGSCTEISQHNSTWILGTSTLLVIDSSHLNTYSAVGHCGDGLLPGDVYH